MKFAVNLGNNGQRHMYTNGSATGETTAGGAAMVATVGDPADPVIIHTDLS